MIYRHDIFLGRQLGKVHNSLYSAVCIFGLQDSVLIFHGCFAMFSPSLLSRRLPFNRASNSNRFLSARPFLLQVSRIPSWQLTRLHLPAGRHSCRGALFHTSSLPLPSSSRQVRANSLQSHFLPILKMWFDKRIMQTAGFDLGSSSAAVQCYDHKTMPLPHFFFCMGGIS